MFERLLIHNWRQFEHIDITFHKRLTVLTGANGSGKTTLLHLLNRHWGWNLDFVSSPRPGATEKEKYWAGFWGDKVNGHNENQFQTTEFRIGDLIYRGGATTTLRVSKNISEVFDVLMSPPISVHGVYVPSHRPAYIFQSITQIPVKLDAKEQVFDVYKNEMVARYTGRKSGSGTKSSSFLIKSSLMSLAVFGHGNAAVEPDLEAKKTFEEFQNILRRMLPPSLGFKAIKVKTPDVFVVTDNGDITFDAVSGGIAAIMDIAWQILMYSRLYDEFVVVIDEPEAHLHPALQQRLLPDLLEAFPRCQFIIATHSPFMVTSVADSNVFVLRYNESNRVDSVLLDAVNKAGTADEVLMDVLGVPSTLPNWAKAKVESVIREFTELPLTRESMLSLRTKMSELGMAHLFPETLAKVAESKP